MIILHISPIFQYDNPNHKNCQYFPGFYLGPPELPCSMPKRCHPWCVGGALPTCITCFADQEENRAPTHPLVNHHSYPYKNCYNWEEIPIFRHNHILLDYLNTPSYEKHVGRLFYSQSSGHVLVSLGSI